MPSSTENPARPSTPPITFTKSGRPCSPFSPIKIFTDHNLIPHAKQGPRPVAELPTELDFHTLSAIARENLTEIDAYIQAATELRDAGKPVIELIFFLRRLLFSVGDVHATAIELKAALKRLKDQGHL